MSAINDLIAQIEDDGLRQRISAELKRLLKQKKFGLVFEEHKPKGLCEGPVYPCLQVMDEVKHAPDDALWHALIEADNYYALQLLAYLYPGQVDCIYIDPPYNTGARDWKYNKYNMLDSEIKKESNREIEWLGFRRRAPQAVRESRPNQFYPIFVDKSTGYIHSIGDVLPHGVNRFTTPIPENCVALWPLSREGDERLWSLQQKQALINWGKGYLKVNWNKQKETGTVYYLPEGTIEDIENGNATVLGHNAETFGGTTLRAVNLLNAEDGGHRRCIMVTNNEVSEQEAKTLTKQGFKLEFLDKTQVALGRQFRELLPLLWMKASAIGPCPQLEGDETPQMLVLPENGFAVLTDERAIGEFTAEVNRHDGISMVYLVVDSDAMYREMAHLFPRRQTCQLYRDYLDNFRINVTR